MRTYRALHTNSKIFFPDPYVVRVEYDGNLFDNETDARYRKLLRQTYKLIKGTWGHSPLVFETLQNSENDPSVVPAPLTQQQIMTAIFSSDYRSVKRGYLCFEDELDALQFRLSIDVTAIQVVMWPKQTSFTIHELVVEEDE